MCKVLVKKTDTNIEYCVNTDFVTKFEDTTECISEISQHYAHDFSVDYAEKNNPILKLNGLAAKQGDYVLIDKDGEFVRIFPGEFFFIESAEE